MDHLIIKSFIPEIFLSFSILFQLIFNIRLVNKVKEINFTIITKEIYIQTVFILLSLAILYQKVKITGYVTNYLFSNDKSILLFKFIFILISIALLIIIKRVVELQKVNFIEYYSIFLLSVLSLLCMFSCEHLMTFYLIMEMQAICFYILASINRGSVFSAEAGLKYFISGSFISGFYLFACSIIYGCLGTLALKDISALITVTFSGGYNVLNIILIVCFAIIVFTLLFKLACAPFHFWAPDVYDGAPLSSTIIFSVLPKCAIFYFFIKISIAFGVYFKLLGPVLQFFGVLSILIGTVGAYGQKELKRLIIYSSISQTGFLIIFLSLMLDSLESLTFLFFYMFIYLLTSMAMWSYVAILSTSADFSKEIVVSELKTVYITDLVRLCQINFTWSLPILICFFSIAGIPPLVGFLPKMLSLYVMIQGNMVLGSILVIIISAVSVYYYIKLIKMIYFEYVEISKNSLIVLQNGKVGLEYFFIALISFILIFLFFFPDLLLLISQYLVYNMFLL